jgi:uncharacterized membrane protein YcaP (DUF421 family)
MAAVLRGIFGYLFLVLMMRLVGRRPGKQMAPFEYILIFFIGGLTLTPMVGSDRSITNAITIIFSIGLTHYATTVMRRRWPSVGRVLDGTPVVLLDKGNWQTENLTKLHVRDDCVMAAARGNGMKSLEQLDYAVLERNGQISVIKADEQRRSAD